MAPRDQIDPSSQGGSNQDGGVAHPSGSAGGGLRELPSVQAPSGGGALRGMGETFSPNPQTGAGSLRIPVPLSPGRDGFAPELALTYDTGGGNGAFGLGWALTLPSIQRKTDKGLPRYREHQDSDIFVLSGADDLVPALVEENGEWVPLRPPSRLFNGNNYRIDRFRPRIEGGFTRIERWTNEDDAADCFWRTISSDNLTTWFGRDGQSRIVDPADPSRIFRWLICEVHDDRGQVIRYEYATEDGAAVDTSQLHETNRTADTRATQRYVKNIRYGNAEPFFGAIDDAGTRAAMPDNWHFELVLDYGDHDADVPTSVPDRPWIVRSDPFSTYRAGFEIRTYRLCRRLLMFHHFPLEEDVGDNCLVRSVALNYGEDDLQSARPALLHGVVESGHRRDGAAYATRALPAAAFAYSPDTLSDSVQTVELQSLADLPLEFDTSKHSFVDLQGEGMSGLLIQQGRTWHFKRNLSPLTDQNAPRAVFDAATPLSSSPSLTDVEGRGAQFVDLAGDGQLDVVSFDSVTPGFYEKDNAGGWQDFRTFEALPNLDWDSPDLRFVDLTGDGLADVLITGDDTLIWHPSQGERGFSRQEKLQQALDEEDGPRMLFSDARQSLHLADMSGDGLSDLLRIRRSEICYWPNLGYGRFGAKVSMDVPADLPQDSPLDLSLIRLGDIDGTGTTDIVYLGAESPILYRNRFGNGWDTGFSLAGFPQVDRRAEVQLVDLMGNGTDCLVWTSKLPGDAGTAMRYVNFMQGGKPHLLIHAVNGLGAESRVRYAPSTLFYLQDMRAGRPWLTHLPQVVQVVERVELRDRVNRTRFTTRYAYHHGYFDGRDREFRGFGMVESWDAEEFAAMSADGAPLQEGEGDAINLSTQSQVPPVLKRTWYHTGMYLGRDRVSNQFAGLLDGRDRGEYYRETGADDPVAASMLLPDTVLPEGLTTDEAQEACRALKGRVLRTEIYAQDGTAWASEPYTVTETNFSLRLIQRKARQAHAVVFAHDRETLEYQYERDPTDPRVSHEMVLAVDEFGNVLRSASLGYGRRQPNPELLQEIQDVQTQTLIETAETIYTNVVEQPDAYRMPVPADAARFELTGFELPAEALRFTLEDMRFAMNTAERIDFHVTPQAGLQIRSLSRTRSIYRRDDLSGPLPLGQQQSMALPFESYQQAMHNDHLARIISEPVPDDVLEIEGGYLRFADEPVWSIPSGQIFYSLNTMGDSAAELAEARTHFFIPRRLQNAFGQASSVVYDRYALLALEALDALGNRRTAGERSEDGTVTPSLDYRVLQPRLLTDPNGNRTAIAYDVLGLQAGAAEMGKPADPLGDTLDGFDPDPNLNDVAALLENPNGPIAVSLLGNATARTIYDSDRFQRLGEPSFVATLEREMHVGASSESALQISFSHSDGSGRIAQVKFQAEPGPIDDVVGDVERWTATGWTILNNKGDPVKQYEPFFTTSPRFEFGVARGVSPTNFYDPVGRLFGILHPDHRWQKIRFGPWRQESWDVNDTVLVADPSTDPDIGAHLQRLETSDYLPTWHERRSGGSMGAAEQNTAEKAAMHADTSTVLHFDALGRPVLQLADNGEDGLVSTATEWDIDGQAQRIVDDRGNSVVEYRLADPGVDAVPGYDLAGRPLFHNSMDRGERRILHDVFGNEIRRWDGRGQWFRARYDALRRQTHLFVQQESQDEILIERTVYGEAHAEAEARNLREQVFRIYDGAGVAENRRFDAKGNMVDTARRFARDYRQDVDWSVVADPDAPDLIAAAAEALLEPEEFAALTDHDALNRPIVVTLPDESVTRPAYDAAGRLNQLTVQLRDDANPREFVSNIEYNARGQRVLIRCATADGTDISTQHIFDPETFRLRRLETRRHRDDVLLQALDYAYDPIGNLTSIADGAQQTVFFSNSEVSPEMDYTFDALYRLRRASGREHASQNIPQRDHDDLAPVIGTPFPNSPEAMQRYVEDYDYDSVGNVLSLRHRGGGIDRWTRRYLYAQNSNRLDATSLPSDPAGVHSAAYAHDENGNMTGMPHLEVMTVNAMDELRSTSRQSVAAGTPETTYFVYNADGERMRKVTDASAEAEADPVRRHERFYLGGFEIYREFGPDGTTVSLERETLHVLDGSRRFGQIDTRTVGNDPAPPQSHRLHLGNHLGSAALELDQNGNLVSYEEYHPFGGSAYRAGRSLAETSLKRHRFAAKERDSETGLYYFGARYYAAGLCRWISPDPLGIEDGLNLYAYVGNNPVTFIDPTGLFAAPGEPDPEVLKDMEKYEVFQDAAVENEDLWQDAKPLSKQKRKKKRKKSGGKGGKGSAPGGGGSGGKKKKKKAAGTPGGGGDAPSGGKGGSPGGGGASDGPPGQGRPGAGPAGPSGEGPPGGSGDGDGVVGGSPDGSGGEGDGTGTGDAHTAAEEAAGVAAVMLGEDINLRADETRFGIPGGMGSKDVKLSAGGFLAYIAAREAFYGLALGGLGRLGGVFRRLKLNKFADKFDEIAGMLRTEKKALDTAEKKALPKSKAEKLLEKETKEFKDLGFAEKDARKMAEEYAGHRAKGMTDIKVKKTGSGSNHNPEKLRHRSNKPKHNRY